jgi:non-ribosomal peptide synthetase component E (peptide arylation enzyme)
VAKELLNQNTIKGLLKINLPEYMIPSCIIQVDKTPLTINGKIDKENLKNLIS